MKTYATTSSIQSGIDNIMTNMTILTNKTQEIQDQTEKINHAMTTIFGDPYEIEKRRQEKELESDKRWHKKFVRKKKECPKSKEEYLHHPDPVRREYIASRTYTMEYSYYLECIEIFDDYKEEFDPDYFNHILSISVDFDRDFDKKMEEETEKIREEEREKTCDKNRQNSIF